MSAPYGLKKDGTPKKKPGRKPASMTIERCEREAEKRRAAQRDYYNKNRATILAKAKETRSRNTASRSRTAPRRASPKRRTRPTMEPVRKSTRKKKSTKKKRRERRFEEEV